jgi:VCBS repeat-containing protein
VDTADANVTVTGGSGTGAYGSVVINADGSYVYTLNDADSDTNALSEGQTASDTFTYTISDGEGTSSAVLTVNITGNNDAPAAVADTAGGVVEAGFEATGTATATGNVLLNDTDVDTADANVTVTGGSGTGAYGSVTIAADGNYTYTLNNADTDTNALSEGEVVTDTFNYTISDGEGTSTAVLTVTITGENDAPVGGTDSGSVTETGTVTGDAEASGNVLTNDADPEGDAFTLTAVNGFDSNVGGTVTGTYGSVTISGDGSYDYVLDDGDADTDALSEGQVAVDTFTYTLTDADGASSSAFLNITVTGDNDAPLAVADGQSVQDNDVNNGPVGGDLFANDTDVDSLDATFSVTAVNGSGANVGEMLTGTYSAVTIDADGGYTFTVDENGGAVDALGAGETATDTYTYTMSDDFGATSTTTLVITVTGNNDAPAGTDNTAGVTVASGDETYVFTTADFGFTDPTDGTDDDFASVIIDTDDLTGGTLYLNGVAVTDNQEVGADSIAGGLLTFVQEDSLGGALTNFDFQVRDDGGVANAGVDLDGSANLMNINLLTGDFVGTSNQDNYTALTVGESIFGLGDDDNLEGSSGIDNIFGGTGADNIKGAAGADNINVGTDGDTDTVSIAEAADGGDFITGFLAGADLFRLEGTLTTDLDDIIADGAISFGSGPSVDLTNLSDVAGEFSVDSTTGDDALLVLQSNGSTGIYSYVETSDSTVDAGELTLLAIVDNALLTAGNFNTDIV